MKAKLRRPTRTFRSVRGRMLALAFPLVTVVYTVIVTTAEYHYYEALENELHGRIDNLTEISRHTFASLIWYSDYESLRDGLETLLEDPDVVAAIARDEHRRPLAWSIETAEGRRTNIGELLPDDFPFDDYERRTGETVLEQLETGWIELFFSRSRLRETLLRRVLFHVGIFGLVLLTLVAGVVLATGRTISLPAARWRRTIRLGKGGGALMPVDWVSDDEMGQLIAEYNEMVTVQKRIRDGLEERLEFFEEIFQALDTGLAAFDGDFRLAVFNRRYSEMAGHGEHEIELGMNLSDLLRTDARQGEYGSANVEAVIIDRLAVAAAGERFRRERLLPDGTALEVESIPLPQGGFVSTYTDVTRRKFHESRWRQTTLHDPLTGLPNRLLFQDRLQQALALADRRGTRLAILLVDLDRFAELNARFGEKLGDRVLVETGHRLVKLARSCDTVARWGDDRFAIIQQGFDTVDDPAFLGHRILGTFRRPFVIGEHTVQVNVSIGATLYPDDDENSADIPKNARLALAAAKAEGRRRFRYFIPKTDREVSERRRLEEALFQALRQRQFELHYQPAIHPESGRVEAIEALLRWRHPERGLMEPHRFVSLAAQRGLIGPLDEWVIEEVCSMARRWEEIGGTKQIAWAINLDSHSFQEGHLEASLRGAIDKTGFDIRRLIFEIREAVLWNATEETTGQLTALRELGAKLAWDGFGAGSSPLGILERRHQDAPAIDAVKIDTCLIGALCHDPATESFVRQLIELGRGLELDVTAVAVEEEAQRELLIECGCPCVQGFLVAQPMPEAELVEWLALNTTPVIADEGVQTHG